MGTAPERCWLLWDGECEICRRAAGWVARHDRRKIFRIMPYQSVSSPPMTPELYERCGHSVQVVRSSGAMLAGGQAVAFVLGQIGWRRLGTLLGLGPVTTLTEWFYQGIANNRGLIGRLAFRRGCSDRPTRRGGRPASVRSDGGGGGCERSRAPASAPDQIAGSSESRVEFSPVLRRRSP